MFFRALSWIICLAFVGCSGGDTQTRFRISGDVKYAGQPVPFGEILFTPSGAKGNSGAQGIANINGGKYDTAGSRAPGIAGGPTIIRVTAHSDAKGKLLVEYEYEADLPKADSTLDIDIPADAGKTKKGTPEI